jgi:hypothetical protein
MGAMQRMGRELQLPAPTPDEVHALVNKLSPQAQRRFVDAGSPQEREMLIRGWIRSAWMSWNRPPAVSSERLEAFYLTEVTPDEHERLDQLPPEQLRDQLQRLFHQRHGPPRPPVPRRHPRR